MTEKEKVYRSGHHKRMSTGAVVLAVLVIFTELLVTMAHTSITVTGNTVVVGQGVALMAIMMGSLFWALVEMFTRPGHHWYTLAARFFTAYVVGGFLGAFLGYEFNFGQFLVIPAKSGNMLAIFELAGFLFVFVVIVADAAWLHKRTYIKSKQEA